MEHVNKDKFKYYLTGLLEGDGSIIVPHQDRDSKERKIYPSIQIIFASKDFPLAMIIQKTLNFGSIHKKKGVNAYVLTINSLNNLYVMIELLNGNMYTSKIYALHRLIDFVNNYYNKTYEKKQNRT